ncbi:ATP-binding protein [Gandjariella thermophila]|nr:AAA family ATPase [Gandjariella thermophila]
MTSFIGRHRELRQARRLLRTARLVTLTGPGGVGKTRLAMRLATQPGRQFDDGVRTRDLASVTTRQHLERALIEAVGIYDQPGRPARDVLIEHVIDRDLLLVLDNCDGIAEELGELLEELLRAAPHLVVLATSRRRLECTGEHVLVVPPLTVPDPTIPLARLAASRREAVTLFVERARAVQPRFRLTAGNRAAVAELCARLDGLPLAIELAAARVATLPVQQILASLPRHRFDLLAGGATDYHATLQGVLEFSYRLCSPAERLLWCRLSVFVGSFDLDAAEHVCTGPGLARDEILEVLTGLINQSVVSTSRDPRSDRMRYYLLESLRDFGAAHLPDHRESLTALRRRHRDYYTRLVSEARASWCGPQEVRWMRHLQDDRGNLQAAIDDALRAGHAGTALHMATDLARTRVCFFEGSWRETLGMLGDVIDANPRPSPLRDQAVALHAWIALCQGHPGPARTRLSRYRTLARHPRAHGLAVADAAFVAGVYALLAEGDTDAITLLGRARDEYAHAGENGWEHMALLFGAFAAAFFGDEPLARQATDECRRHAELRQTSWGRWWALLPAGITELRWAADPRVAARLFESALTALAAEGDQWGSLWAALTVAWAYAQTGNYKIAGDLLCGTHNAQEATGVVMEGLGPFAETTARTVDIVVDGLRQRRADPGDIDLADRLARLRHGTNLRPPHARMPALPGARRADRPATRGRLMPHATTPGRLRARQATTAGTARPSPGPHRTGGPVSGPGHRAAHRSTSSRRRRRPSSRSRRTDRK